MITHFTASTDARMAASLAVAMCVILIFRKHVR